MKEDSPAETKDYFTILEETKVYVMKNSLIYSCSFVY